MKVTKELEQPLPPPIKKIIIELSLREAKSLREYLYYTEKLSSNYMISTGGIIQVDMATLYDQLNKILY